jgi:hypothetical protein
MIQTHLYITQTHIEQSALQHLIAKRFFTQNRFDSLFDISYLGTEQSQEEYEHFLAKRQILVYHFDEKKDYRDIVLSLYQKYPTPTLLFLGDITDYSLPLQEGMLRLLEEPPTNLFPIVFARSLSSILPTIASRSCVHTLTQDCVVKLLETNIADAVKKKLPLPSIVAKELIAQSFTAPTKEVSKLERQEIRLWLWQVQVYLEQYYGAKPHATISASLAKVHNSQKLNNANAIKKFVFANLTL